MVNPALLPPCQVNEWVSIHGNLLSHSGSVTGTAHKGVQGMRSTIPARRGFHFRTPAIEFLFAQERVDEREARRPKPAGCANLIQS
jgi:hypothetical protein